MTDSNDSLSSHGRIAIVLDLCPKSWASFFEEQSSLAPDAVLGISAFLDLICAFAHQYNMVNRNNRVSLLALTPAVCVSLRQHFVPIFAVASPNVCTRVCRTWLYPKTEIPRDANEPHKTHSATPKFDFREMCNAVQDCASSVGKDAYSDSAITLPLSSAISRSFLRLFRQEHDLEARNDDESETDLTSALLASSKFPSRIIIFSLTPDSSSQVFATMSAIFACHKQGIIIDSCFLSRTASSPLLQSAADLTNGWHSNIRNKAELQHALLTTLLVDGPMRDQLTMPKLVHVNHTATCFCHNRLISIGYVCSVCLAVFCEPSSECRVCGITFVLESIPSPLALAVNMAR